MDKENIVGGLAFPLPRDIGEEKYWGMTLRDYFAAQVLSTIIKENPNAVSTGGAKQYTANAYAWADLMIQSREGAEQPTATP